MTVLERVKNFIDRSSPRATCDDCIADSLNLSVQQHANHKTRELAGLRGYDRRKDACAICGKTKLVIRQR